MPGLGEGLRSNALRVVSREASLRTHSSKALKCSASYEEVAWTNKSFPEVQKQRSKRKGCLDHTVTVR
jgi:hypothetical protein